MDNLAKSALVNQYTPLVRSIAKQIKKTLTPRIEMDDLMGYGITGLLEAAERYDPKHGANFSTFSYYRVRGAIYDGLRGMGWLSRNEYQKIRFGERANAYLENQANRNMGVQDDRRSPNDHVEELASQVSQLVTIFVTSLDAMEDMQVEDEHLTRQDQLFEDRQAKQMLRQAISELDREDQELLRLYYFQDLSLEEVGEKIGLSKSWTCRKHAQVIEKLGSLFRQKTMGAFPKKRPSPPKKASTPLQLSAQGP